tara:strand:+ start:2643 stop:2927 length:285 start_codon:yes stop_codon:yes gene_type:complete
MVGIAPPRDVGCVIPLVDWEVQDLIDVLDGDAVFLKALVERGVVELRREHLVEMEELGDDLEDITVRAGIVDEEFLISTIRAHVGIDITAGIHD